MAEIGFAITGASGIIYGLRTIEEILKAGYTIYFTISDCGRIVLKQELDIEISDNPNIFFQDYFKSSKIKYYSPMDFFSPLASGTSDFEAMLVIPCSMKTVGAIASGYSQNLIERACDVSLKESKKLIIMPRETPLNQIHLSNLLKLSQMGAHIVPAMPAFYNHPEKINDLVNFMAGKVLNLLKIKHELIKPWGENKIQSPVSSYL